MARLEPVSKEAANFGPINVPSSGELVLGRGAHPGSVILPQDWRQVSSKHCRIFCEQGQWTFESLGRNGCYVAGAKLGKGEARMLVGGEEIKVSHANDPSDPALVNWTFKIFDGDAAPAAASPANGKAAERPVTADLTRSKDPSPAAPDTGAKRKAGSNPPSPGAAKRGRSSDAGSWALELNAKLRQQLQEQHEAHQAELAALKQRGAEDRRRAEEAEAGLAARQQTLQQAAEAEAARQMQLAAAQAEIAALKERVAAADAELASLRIEAEELRCERTALQTQQAGLAERLAAAEGQTSELESLRAQAQAAQEAVEAARAELGAESKANDGLKAQLEAAEESTRAAGSRERMLRNELEVQQHHLADLAASLAQLQQADALIDSEAVAVTAAISRQQEAAASRREQVAALRRQLAFATDQPQPQAQLQLETQLQETDMDQPMEADEPERTAQPSTELQPTLGAADATPGGQPEQPAGLAGSALPAQGHGPGSPAHRTASGTASKASPHSPAATAPGLQQRGAGSPLATPLHPRASKTQPTAADCRSPVAARALIGWSQAQAEPVAAAAVAAASDAEPAAEPAARPAVSGSPDPKENCPPSAEGTGTKGSAKSKREGGLHISASAAAASPAADAASQQQQQQQPEAVQPLSEQQ